MGDESLLCSENLVAADGEGPLHVVVGMDGCGWHVRFAEGLDRIRLRGSNLTYSVANLECEGWTSAINDSDVVLWKPAYMGPVAAAQFCSKVFFVEHVLQKLIVPNYASTWHFENKIAQHYIFEAHNVPTPATVACFDYHDALARVRRETLPLVWKEAHGAGSEHVRIVATLSQAERLLETRFAQQLWMEALRDFGSPYRAVLLSLGRRWLWQKLLNNLLGRERFASAYWQRFIPGNMSDLRVTTIGNRYAYWFIRDNRDGDFRASGSGRIRYEGNVPEQAIIYCLRLSRQLGFDSMAYDLLHDGNRFVLSEMSFGYLDSAPYNAPGYFEWDGANHLSFVEGHVWPQYLWAEWAIERCRLRRLRPESQARDSDSAVNAPFPPPYLA